MADYYSPAVFTDTVGLTNLLQRVLEIQGGTLYKDGYEETILDGIVNERTPISRYHVTFSEGWNCSTDLEDYLEDINEDGELEEELSPEEFTEIKRLLELPREELLLEILKVDPDTETIEVQCGFSCSKMRIDGYGGYGLVVNRKGYLSNTTTDFAIDDDGTIKPGAIFTKWLGDYAIA
jgi:hypothetical protein